MSRIAPPAEIVDSIYELLDAHWDTTPLAGDEPAGED
jgi:hypothetical protein